ncbi:MAG: hypothetical protein WBZ36_26535, partial [Candidatus Nitrosopolaris sp.]
LILQYDMPYPIIPHGNEIWPQVQLITILAGELSRNIAIFIYNMNPRLSLSMKGLPRIKRKSLAQQVRR